MAVRPEGGYCCRYYNRYHYRKLGFGGSEAEYPSQCQDVLGHIQPHSDHGHVGLTSQSRVLSFLFPTCSSTVCFSEQGLVRVSRPRKLPSEEGRSVKTKGKKCDEP
jgi:hypothetical protein